MSWSNGLETEEQEIPDHVLVVMVQSVKASHHVGDLQLLLSVLQQRDEGPLGAFRQLVGANTDIQSFLPQHSLPVGAGAAQACGRECYLGGLLLVTANCRLGYCILVFVGFLSIDLKVRGISFVPRASALWELPTCAGDIKPAVEARRPNSWWRWCSHPPPGH